MLVKVFSYALIAGAAKSFPGGRFFRLLVADAAVDIEFFDEAGGSIGVAAGVKGGFEIGIEPSDIGKVSRLIGFARAVVTSSINQTVDVAISRQPIRYDRITGTVTTTSSSGTTIPTPTSVTAGAASAALLAANANRLRAFIKNTSPTETVYVSDDGTAATTSHYPILPGETLIVQSQDGLNCIRGAATDAVLRVLEERA